MSEKEIIEELRKAYTALGKARYSLNITGNKFMAKFLENMQKHILEEIGSIVEKEWGYDE